MKTILTVLLAILLTSALGACASRDLNGDGIVDAYEEEVDRARAMALMRNLEGMNDGMRTINNIGPQPQYYQQAPQMPRTTVTQCIQTYSGPMCWTH